MQQDNSGNEQERVLPLASEVEAGEQLLPLASEVEAKEEPISLVEEDEPISLVDDSAEPMAHATHKVRQFGRLGAEHKTEFAKAPNVTGKGAIRCRLFHSRIALEALDNMQDRINQWLDGEQIEVKHVGHLMGTMEGKNPKPNMMVMVWY